MEKHAHLKVAALQSPRSSHRHRSQTSATALPIPAVRNRSCSLDSGAKQLIQDFYQQKIVEAKEEGNVGLQQVLAEIETEKSKGEEKRNTGEGDGLLIELERYCKELVSSDPHKLLAGGRISAIIERILKLKQSTTQGNEKQQGRKNEILNKVLFIISRFSRLLSCLDETQGDLTNFFAWIANDITGKKENKERDISDHSPRTMEERKEEMLICRICESSVYTSLLEEHTTMCVSLRKVREQSQYFNEAFVQILAELDGLEKNTVNSQLEKIIQSVIAKTSYEECEKLFRQLQYLKNQNYNKLPAFFRNIESTIKEKMDTLQQAASLATSIGVGTTKSELPAKKTIQDFEYVKPISRGSFGQVFLARQKKTGDLYAIKALKKSEMECRNQVDNVKNERNILAIAQNPFVVKLFYTFQTSNYLFMVMEYVSGGDCFSLLRSLGVFSEPMAKQFVAELVLALDYLHSRDIVHRDLKPDNMLINSEGHIKLTDFGLSAVGLLNKQNDVFDWKAFKNCMPVALDKQMEQGRAVGTPDYLAPEVFLGTKTSVSVTSVDWWAVGCILYEFLVGITPFYGESVEEIFQNILAYNIVWPDDIEISPDAVDLITKLLNINPKERLGSNGGHEVRNHPWFKGIEWDNLIEKPPLFVPKVKEIGDTSYFDARNEHYQVDSKLRDEISNTDSPVIERTPSKSELEKPDSQTSTPNGSIVEKAPGAEDDKGPTNTPSTEETDGRPPKLDRTSQSTADLPKIKGHERRYQRFTFVNHDHLASVNKSMLSRNRSEIVKPRLDELEKEVEKEDGS